MFGRVKEHNPVAFNDRMLFLHKLTSIICYVISNTFLWQMMVPQSEGFIIDNCMVGSILG